jgi:hypothetical protein
MRDRDRWILRFFAMMTIACLALLIFHAVCSADETTVFPEEGKAAAVCVTTEEGRWLVVADGFMPVAARTLRLADGGSVVIWQGDPGDRYGAIFIPNDQDQPLQSHAVKLTGARPPPGPGPEPGPDPPPPPPPPVPPTSGELTIITIRPDQPTADQKEQLLVLRTWADRQPRGRARSLDFTRGQPGPSGIDASAASWVAKVPPGATIPYAFVTQPRTDGGGQAVLWEGPMSRAADVIARAEEVLR